MARVPLVQDDDEAARMTGIFDTFKDEGRPPSELTGLLPVVVSINPTTSSGRSSGAGQ